MDSESQRTSTTVVWQEITGTGDGWTEDSEIPEKEELYLKVKHESDWRSTEV